MLHKLPFLCYLSKIGFIVFVYNFIENILMQSRSKFQTFVVFIVRVDISVTNVVPRSFTSRSIDLNMHLRLKFPHLYQG
jgi:hypothetical protein